MSQGLHIWNSGYRENDPGVRWRPGWISLVCCLFLSVDSKAWSHRNPGLLPSNCLEFLSCRNHPGDPLLLSVVLWLHGSRPRPCSQAHGPQWIISDGHLLFNAVSQNWLCGWVSQGLRDVFPFKWGSILFTFEKLSYSVNRLVGLLERINSYKTFYLCLIYKPMIG